MACGWMRPPEPASFYESGRGQPLTHTPPPLVGGRGPAPAYRPVKCEIECSSLNRTFGTS
jgi:hypothetical protein